MINTKILIVSATEFELGNFIRNNCKEINSNLFQCYDNQYIRVLVTGIGMVNMTLELSHYFSENKVDKAINIGFAGSFNNNFNFGSIVNVYEDCFAEMGVINEDNTISKLFNQEIINNEYSGFIKCKNPISDNIFNSFPLVKGITVNSCTNNIQRMDFFKNNIKGQIESMEGASFIKTCNHYNVKCIQLRSISNIIGNNAQNNWDIKKAVNSIELLLSKILV